MQAEFEPVQQSLVSWTFAALGLYAILLAVAGLVSFALALIVVVRGRGPMATSALLLIVPVPFLLGIFAAIHGAINSYSVVAMSSSSPKPSEIAMGISTALVAPLVGMLMMAPAYTVAAIGSIIRTFSAASNQSIGKS